MAVHARTHTSERVSAALARHALVPRLIVAPPPLASSVQLHARGAISCLAVEPLPAIVEEGDLAAGEAKLRVRAISLNFRDMLGEYPRDPGPPIGDCAGKNCRDRRPGHALRVRGDAALGLAYAPLALVARANALLLARKARCQSFEQACSLPVVCSTVHGAFGRSRLRACKRLLSHAAAGGVGVATIEAASWLSATIGVSVGHPYKHAQLRSSLALAPLASLVSRWLSAAECRSFRRVSGCTPCSAAY